MTNNIPTVFLGSSQTFLGTLLTIVLLCIFKGSSNFIEAILKSAKDRLRNNINLINKTPSSEYINNATKTITEHSNYKLLVYYLNSDKCKEDREQSKELPNKVSSFISNVANRFLDIQYKSLDLHKKLLTRLDQISEDGQYNEIYMSPLYVFIFSIMIFIYDELFTNGYVDTNFLVTSLSLMLLLSLMFMTLIWLNYFFKSRRDIDNEGYFSKIKQKNVNITTFISRAKSNILAIYVIFISIAFLVGFCCDNQIMAKTIFVIFAILPLTIIGGCKLGTNVIYYADIYIVRHFLTFFIASLGISLIFFLTSEYHIFDSIIFYYSNLKILKMAVLLFILFFGVVIPFTLPWYRYHTYNVYAKKMARNNVKNINIYIKDTNIEMGSLTKEIP